VLRKNRALMPGTTVRRQRHPVTAAGFPLGPGPDLSPNGHIHVMWLLPITAAERDFKLRQGLEALEKRFESCALEYWVSGRASVT
jgi:hypothetical protein